MRSSLQRAVTAGVAALAISCAHQEPAPEKVAKPQPPPPKTAAPAASPLVLLPADLVRSALVATFVAPWLDRSLVSGVALVQRAAPLPVDPSGVREMALAQAGLSSEVAKNLNLSAAISGASVAGAPGEPMVTAFTFAAKDPARAAALLEAIGQVVARRGTALRIQTRAGESAWFIQVGSEVVFSDTQEGLARAGSLALEARKGPSVEGDDVTAVIYPDALAHWQGTDVKSVMERLVQQVESGALAPTNRPLAPAEAESLRQLAGYLADVAVAQVALRLEEKRGAAIKIRLVPRPGTALEALGRETRVVPVDPLLLRKGEAGWAFTSAYREPTIKELRRLRGRLGAPPPGGKSRESGRAAELLEALADGITGDFSMVGRLLPSLSFDAVYPARDRAAGGRVQRAVERMDRAGSAALWSAVSKDWGLSDVPVKSSVERVGRVRAVHLTIAAKAVLKGKDPGQGQETRAEVLRKLLGDGDLDVYAAVVGGDRLAIAAGKDAKTRLAAMAAAGGSGAPGAVLAEAMAAAERRSLFYFLDLRQLTSTLGAVLPAADALGRGTEPLPVWGGVEGDANGRVLTLDLTVPPSCFSGLGAFLQGAALPTPGAPPGGSP